MRSCLNRVTVILLFTAVNIIASAQVADTTLRPLPLAPLPDSLLSKDAVVMMERLEFVYRLSKYQGYQEVLISTQNIHKQIKILTKKGLEDYTIVSIPKNRYTELEDLNVFLIKANGTIVKKKAEMLEIRDPEDNSNLASGVLRFSIPGTEVGDVVDFSIKITNPTGGGYAVDLFFHDGVPILNSTTILRFKNSVRFKIQGYNGLEINRAAGKAGDSIFTWEFAYIPAILGRENGILENELPFCRYMITSVNYSNNYRPFDQLSFLSWGATFEPTIKGISRPSPRAKKSEYFNELMARLLKGCDTCSKLTGFRKVFNYITDSIRIVDSKEPENYSSGYYLWQRSLDRYSLFILYKDLFRYFDYKGYFVFTRNRFMGMMDANWVSRDFYTQLWLAFRDEKGDMHFLLPKTNWKKNFIDEVDPLLMGTKAFLVNAENAFDYTEIFMPATGYEKNVRERHVNATIDGDLLRYSINEIVQGCLSTTERANEAVAGKDSLQVLIRKKLEREIANFMVDSVIIDTPDPLPPFTYQIKYSGSQTGRIISIDDSISTIGLNDWLGHSTISTLLESRNLDYYTAYPYTEKFISTYIFPGQVELLNEKVLNSFYDNDFGTYSLKVYQIEPNKIMMESLYCIKSAYIPATKYLLLKEINNRYNQSRDAKLLVRKIF